MSHAGPLPEPKSWIEQREFVRTLARCLLADEHAAEDVAQEEVWRIFRLEFGLKDAESVRRLEKEWYDHLDKKLTLVTVSGLARAGFSAADDGRKLRAQRLFKEATEKGSESPLVFHRYAQLLEMDGKAGEAKAMLEKSIELNPLEGKLDNALGNRLGARKDPDSARWIALGEELGYEDAWVDLSEFEDKGKDKDG